jgi:hypothetical protein
VDKSFRHAHSQLFTVRVWREILDEENHTEWRGLARHLPGGTWRYFRNWPALIEFMVEALSKAENDDPTDDRFLF